MSQNNEELESLRIKQLQVQYLEKSLQNRNQSEVYALMGSLGVSPSSMVKYEQSIKAINKQGGIVMGEKLLTPEQKKAVMGEYLYDELDILYTTMSDEEREEIIGDKDFSEIFFGLLAEAQTFQTVSELELGYGDKYAHHYDEEQ